MGNEKSEKIGEEKNKKLKTNMNKRIIVSLSVIGLVAAIAIGGTVAYFSDTETSTGNLFVAGSIDLKVDNHCYYNGYECVPDGNDGYVWAGTDEPCYCTWDLTNLKNELFFDFEDMKPGDWGEDTVSLHVYDNDAWACVAFEKMVDYDNGCTEPEKKAERAEYGAGNVTCDGAGDGELSENLYFKFWADMCDAGGETEHPFYPASPGDDIFQPECDVYLVDDYASEIVPGRVFTLAAPEYNIFTGMSDDPLIGSKTYYIGKVWCFGEIGAVVDPGTLVHHWTCNGQPVNNLTQTDSLTGDIVFYAEQARNNDNFDCSTWNPGPPAQPVCGDGWITGNERCEADADCGPGAFCNNPGTPLECQCVTSELY